MKTFKEFIQATFGGKANTPELKQKQFPNSVEANDWMTTKVDHYAKHKPEHLHMLFSPASGEYMPTSVHVGSSWKKEHAAHYNSLKAKHPGAIEKAKQFTKTHGPYAMSRVGPQEDRHGVSVLD